MESMENPTARRLFWALMRFRKMAYHKRPLAGLPPGEGRLLFCIKFRGKSSGSPVTVTDISRMLRVTSPTVSQLLNSLEAKGLIERRTDPTDRRSTVVLLTDEGDRITDLAAATVYAELSDLVEYLGEEKSDQFTDLLLKVADFLRERYLKENDFSYEGDDYY